MLQNPSKYHPNPLSHFLALHNSQAAHNARNNGNNLANATAFGLCGGSSSHNNSTSSQFVTQQTHTLQQQQQTQNQIYNHTHQQQQQQPSPTQQHNHANNTSTTHAHQHAQFLDATGTTLDVGKSFTIAAILGLQNRNNNNNNHSKDFTNAINLSLNGNQQQQQQTKPSTTLTPANAAAQISHKHCTPTNHTPNRESNINTKAELIMSTANKFHCDNNTGLVNPYFSSASVLTTAASTTAVATASTAAFIASAAHQQHQLQQQSSHHPLMASHVRANSFAAAAAVAAVAAANVNAVVNGSPSALQSLQQLHQHHAQQTSLSFARDKLKSDSHSSKKSSLKNKRVRTIFTPEQLERLEAEFERQQYMVGPERLYLAHTLQLTEAQVKVWFQNRRIKWRKHHLELTQQRLALLRQNQLQTGAVGSALGTLPSPDALTTVASNSSFDENDEPNIKNEVLHHGQHNNDTQRSHSDTESELSVCNDSMDADSVNDGGGDT